MFSFNFTFFLLFCVILFSRICYTVSSVDKNYYKALYLTFINGLEII